ncbi:cytochrome c [Vibrio europaeus]|uniref:Cytochrome c n=1 Tax=Vibrio europaeus TaxID=300876 RepID=A0AAE7B0L1_9VIBR|nr:cytochrome c [Vibrio europaeus]MDC5805741.1 cytochrome c [Vibrio europaeus]MDC5826185.1 cytochrome c [Vibrio europaeus]MDC5831550.1 cytochrome c [Vibrio europaeus]MDC5834505.1 cytochrome c [Vibrio europaeus]QJY38471.1 cytochrome c [Vibrio europaeus]
MNKVIVSLLCLTPLLVNAQDYSQQIEQRQHAFEQVETLVKSANRTLDGSQTDWDKLQVTSLELKTHSQSLLALFPTGSQQGSKAKESVWSKPEKFNQLLLQMDKGFGQLYQASQQQSPSLAESGLDSAQKTCKSCHRSYRSRW